ncbi:MAG: DinB family protein [Thermomicrobiales bacterium]|nr:DinB family protein [Thermomicrobiales bacterium]
MTEPPIAGDEASTLLGYLERQRATFAWKSGGLGSVGLQATLGDSAMTLGGMLKHLARFEDDMSAEWIQGREQLPPWNAVDWDADPGWDWRTASDDTAEDLYTGWQDAVARARTIINSALATRGLDSPQVGVPSLRYVLLNMIEEYARHNGHADLIRESVDGLVGHDPPDTLS